jgi:hypothetical protein
LTYYDGENVTLIENNEEMLKYDPKIGAHDAKSFKSRGDDLPTLRQNCN